MFQMYDVNELEGNVNGVLILENEGTEDGDIMSSLCKDVTEVLSLCKDVTDVITHIEGVDNE